MARIGTFLCLLLTLGCSTVQITSETLVPVAFEKKASHTKDISIKGAQDFYLWGLFPSARPIRIDKVFAEKGIQSVAEFEIESFRSMENLGWTFLTLGFYAPKSYILKGKTLQ